MGTCGVVEKVLLFSGAHQVKLCGQEGRDIQDQGEDSRATAKDVMFWAPGHVLSSFHSYLTIF